MKESVSVVIPTYKRYDEVQRAVQSALSQTSPPLEVIVVNDGEDSTKREMFDRDVYADISYFEAPMKKSASATRNYGVSKARGEWIALLDDDDVWASNKLEVQFSALRDLGLEAAILAGKEQILLDGQPIHVRPDRIPSKVLPMDLVLFGGSGGVHTSTLMAPRWLFEKFPFDESIERHEDWQWLLEAGQQAQLIVAPEVVCSRYLEAGEGLSRPGGFSFSRRWYQKNQELMSSEGKAMFVASILSRKAAYDFKISVLPWLLVEVSRSRSLNIKLLVSLFLPWLIPHAIRKNLKSWLNRL